MTVRYTRRNVSFLGANQPGRAFHDKWIQAMNLSGLCCSWAMDYVKKCLAQKTLNQQTYNDDSRIKKIATRHALQNVGGIGAVAKSYGLRLGAVAFSIRTSHIAANVVSGGLAPGAYYYVELWAKKQGRVVAHGFAFHCQTATQGVLADSYSGVYDTIATNCAETIEDHCTGVFGDDLTNVFAYPLTLS